MASICFDCNQEGLGPATRHPSFHQASLKELAAPVSRPVRLPPSGSRRKAFLIEIVAAESLPLSCNPLPISGFAVLVLSPAATTCYLR